VARAAASAQRREHRPPRPAAEPAHAAARAVQPVATPVAALLPFPELYRGPASAPPVQHQSVPAHGAQAAPSPQAAPWARAPDSLQSTVSHANATPLYTGSRGPTVPFAQRGAPQMASGPARSQPFSSTLPSFPVSLPNTSAAGPAGWAPLSTGPDSFASPFSANSTGPGSFAPPVFLNPSGPASFAAPLFAHPSGPAARTPADPAYPSATARPTVPLYSGPPGPGSSSAQGLSSSAVLLNASSKVIQQSLTNASLSPYQSAQSSNPPPLDPSVPRQPPGLAPGLFGAPSPSPSPGPAPASIFPSLPYAAITPSSVSFPPSSAGPGPAAMAANAAQAPVGHRGSPFASSTSATARPAQGALLPGPPHPMAAGPFVAQPFAPAQTASTAAAAVVMPAAVSASQASTVHPILAMSGPAASASASASSTQMSQSQAQSQVSAYGVTPPLPLYTTAVGLPFTPSLAQPGRPLIATNPLTLSPWHTPGPTTLTRSMHGQSQPQPLRFDQTATTAPAQWHGLSPAPPLFGQPSSASPFLQSESPAPPLFGQPSSAAPFLQSEASPSAPAAPHALMAGRDARTTPTGSVFATTTPTTASTVGTDPRALSRLVPAAPAPALAATIPPRTLRLAYPTVELGPSDPNETLAQRVARVTDRAYDFARKADPTLRRVYPHVDVVLATSGADCLDSAILLQEELLKVSISSYLVQPDGPVTVASIADDCFFVILLLTPTFDVDKHLPESAQTRPFFVLRLGSATIQKTRRFLERHKHACMGEFRPAITPPLSLPLHEHLIPCIRSTLERAKGKAGESDMASLTHSPSGSTATWVTEALNVTMGSTRAL
jgi:hypothetical protein